MGGVSILAFALDMSFTRNAYCWFFVYCILDRRASKFRVGRYLMIARLGIYVFLQDVMCGDWTNTTALLG